MSIKIENEQIIRMQACASGFKDAFYILYNSFICKEGSENWDPGSDIMSLLATTSCFAVELYLKFLMVINSFDEKRNYGYHCRGHELDELYSQLNKYYPDTIIELENEYSKSHYKGNNNTLLDFLKSIKKHFVNWRYAYESGSLDMNLNTMSDTLNMLNKFATKKYNPIADKLSAVIPSGAFKDKQSMIMNDYENIKKMD